MQLSVSWKNCTRPETEKVLAEITYRDALLDMGSPEQIHRAAMIYAACPNKPFLDYPRMCYYARRVATRRLNPDETVRAMFHVEFN